MHAVPEQIKPHYIQAPKALSFTELYSPRNGTILLGKHEKSFWRTRDRVEFSIYENRSSKVVFVTCRNIDNQEAYRTIFLCAETLFFEVEVKASESDTREKLVRKKDKVLSSDELLHKAATDYILARLLITNDPLPWPDFIIPPPEQSTQSEPTSPVRNEPPELSSSEPIGPLEKMCTFSKISSDKYIYLEINKPAGLSLEGITHTKTEPSAASTEIKPVAVTTSSTSALPGSVPPTVAGTEASTTNVSTNTVPVATGSAPVSAPASAPSSAPTSARLNVPPLKLSGSRKAARAAANAPPTSTAAPASTTNSTVAVTASAAAETSGAGANVPAPPKKVPYSSTASTATSVTSATTSAGGKTATTGPSKGRNTVIVKPNNTPSNTKPNSSSTNTAKDAAATVANAALQEQLPAEASATTIHADITASTINNNSTKTATAATTTATAALLDTAANPTERRKSVAASPTSQRNSILGNRNSKKVVPT